MTPPFLRPASELPIDACKAVAKGVTTSPLLARNISAMVRWSLDGAFTTFTRGAGVEARRLIACRRLPLNFGLDDEAADRQTSCTA